MVPEGAKKYGYSKKLDNLQKGKKQIMDGCKIRQCSRILNKLMTHPVGWVFNQPVDPVKLNIPDYFSIISEPMDLGTIKSKLESKSYSDTEEFAADVRLTFSNAMQYNPPHNEVHLMANELNSIFSLSWKSLEAKWRGDNPLTLKIPISKKSQKISTKSRGICHKTPVSLDSLASKSVTAAEKQTLRKKLAELSNGNMSSHLRNFLRRFGLLGQNGGKIEVDIDAFDEKSVWELHRMMKSCVKARPVEHADVKSDRGLGSQQNSCKGSGDGKRFTCNSVNDMILFARKNSQRNHPNDSTLASSADVDSYKSSGRKNHACLTRPVNLGHLNCEETISSKPRSNTDPDLNGAAAVVTEESVQFSCNPASPSTTCSEGEMILCDEQLSPSKALRAAILRSRFAATIVKAQQKTLLNHGEREDPVKIQQLREQLEKQQQKEREKIEAQLRAEEKSARIKVEAELKMQRQREREAARIALQKMERTVDFDENREVLKDLEKLAFSQPNVFDAALDIMGGGAGNPLERLGLFMKNDYLEDEDAD